MAIHTTNAIVLRSYPFRETSVTVTCMTDRFGKLKGLIKGLRQNGSRHRSAMEPLTENRIVFYDTKDSQLHLISECELVQPLSGIQRDWTTARLGARCVELTDIIVPLEDPQPATYALLRDTLERLNGGLGDEISLHIHFVARLLRLAGFHPQVVECTGCSTHIRERGFWSAQHGGLLCAKCLHEDPKAEPAQADVLQALERLSEEAQPPQLEPGMARKLHERLEEFLRWRLDRPLRTIGLIAS